MASSISRILHQLDLEERILNGASVFALVSVFLPWISGEWLGGPEEDYSGFEFFQSIIGTAVFLLHLCILAVTVVPLFGKHSFVSGKQKEFLRLVLSSQAAILIVATLSVLTKVTFESTRMEIRFGIYCAFIGSVIVAFYSFLKFQQLKKSDSHDHFHHPEDVSAVATNRIDPIVSPPPAPPPPPPALEPEEHRIRP